MALGQIVSLIIISMISISLLVYSYFTAKEKAPILSNSYILATEDERKRIDKSAEYRLVSRVFGMLGVVFLLLAIIILTSWTWLYYPMGVLILILIIYVIKEAIRSEKLNIK